MSFGRETSSSSSPSSPNLTYPDLASRHLQRLTTSLPSSPNPNGSSPNTDGSPITTPLLTPSFQPNSSPIILQSSEITLKALQASLPRSNLKTSLPGTATVDGDDELDLELPISTLLRIGTRRAHVQAENSDGASGLIKGELELKEYIRWLIILWRIYDALELALSEHSSNPVLASIYDPSLLARAPPLSEDIRHLLTLLPEDLSESSDMSDSDNSDPSSSDLKAEAASLPPFPLPTCLQSLFDQPPPALKAYLDQIHNLSRSSASSSSLLLSHAYVRYLGDLSGGQIIGGRIKRAYGLTGSDGTKFYEFNDKGDRSGFEAVSNDEKAGKKRLVEIKDWFRRGMDDGVGDDRELKALLIQEANLSFLLNTQLFSLINPPTKKSESSAVGNAELSTEVKNINEPSQQLRYYEKRALEKAKAAKASVPNTWRDNIERFVTFMASVGFSLGFMWVLRNIVIPELKARGILV